MQGGCFCGSVRYEVEGDPHWVTNCHCEHCRRSTGAPFLTFAGFESDGFRIVRGTPRRHHTRDAVTRQFCDRCGTQLTYQDAEYEQSIYVTVGSLDDPTAVAPRDHIWASRMLPWLRLDDGLPRYEVEP
jgi:hypothetical protein